MAAATVFILAVISIGSQGNSDGIIPYGLRARRVTGVLREKLREHGSGAAATGGQEL